ncbi:hypothetical protein GUITHDRAFT_103390 [Guillardia theta CCMP2712]|uniref:Uncharacterized protein n=1 Tax=Guillardia theta (strain CCMP2712) TaxID=905079 RepID=L1JRL2_GUITC|nr:hypothetical protein GUITHDRAFT_103390 [Guillardia theta CCMP2712]EKX50800.1 hypothetical protein GUITHDRAFT_103390 [Guillardia theta CCMP2712]|eukprot:XP_005837780.1 hypothetical protein GUITHDRAFT_103390 [Guillardia theta CCMP2712]
MRALSDSGQGEDVRVEAHQEYISRSIGSHTSPDAGITDIRRTQVSDPEEESVNLLSHMRVQIDTKRTRCLVKSDHAVASRASLRPVDSSSVAGPILASSQQEVEDGGAPYDNHASGPDLRLPPYTDWQPVQDTISTSHHPMYASGGPEPQKLEIVDILKQATNGHMHGFQENGHSEAMDLSDSFSVQYEPKITEGGPQLCQQGSTRSSFAYEHSSLLCVLRRSPRLRSVGVPKLALERIASPSEVKNDVRTPRSLSDRYGRSRGGALVAASPRKFAMGTSPIQSPRLSITMQRITTPRQDAHTKIVRPAYVSATSIMPAVDSEGIEAAKKASASHQGSSQGNPRLMDNFAFPEDSIFGQTLEKLFSFLGNEQEQGGAHRTYINI